MRTKHSILYGLAWLLVLVLAAPPGILAQSAEGTKTFKQEELDQMLAPIALYPDDLLSQIGAIIDRPGRKCCDAVTFFL